MEKELDEKLNKIGKDIQNPEKKSKTLNVISKRISTPIGILIIVLATTIAGGGILFFYKSVECYSSVDCENRPHIMCVGEWGCVDHKCIWNCETKEITEDETADWQTYTNEEYGFEIKYPEDWQVVAIPSKTVEIQIKRSASDSYFEIIENINENKLTLDEWFEESTIINGKPTIKAAAQPVFINDVKAYRLDSELEPPNPLFEIVGIADSQRRIFSLYAYSKQSTDNKILEQILSTFRFIEEKKDKEELTMDKIENAEYGTCWNSKIDRVKFADGSYTEPPPNPEWATGGWSMRVIEDKIAFGDLNNDGKNDVALILNSFGGGSGSFYEIVILLNDNGGPLYFNCEQLGDRVIINSIDIESGVIILDMIVHDEGDGLCCPSLEKIFKYKLFEDSIEKITEVKN